MEPFRFPRVDEFVNRSQDLGRLEAWWDDKTRDALCVYGRRRVGKSWLFRRFADDKPAAILVASERAFAPQFSSFSEQLEQELGVRPALGDAADLVRVLYRLGRGQRILAVVDEFPYLLPKGDARQAMLSAIAAVMEEERDDSQTKLILCGSIIAQMESLLSEKSPLHGRLHALDVRPMSFGEATPLLEQEDGADRIVRFSVTGGMARHLAELGRGGTLRKLVCNSVLDSRSPLFNDPRLVLERELREPATYFSLLEELARGEAGIDHLAETLRTDSQSLTSYLRTLTEMRLITPHRPAGAPATGRKRKYRLDDGFIRFWFRFVFPHQEDLDSGLKPGDLWDGLIEPALPEHTSQTFEDLCRAYTRQVHGAEAPLVAGWWGEALPKFKDRTQEEIDVVGLKHKRLQVAGECKWTKGQMPLGVLDDLRAHKIPALSRDPGIKPSGKNGPKILLFARSGFTSGLHAAASEDDQVTLIPVDELVQQLSLQSQDD